ncbi:MAG: AAA family ATPase [Candidatus Thorarchaeota archaeon]
MLKIFKTPLIIAVVGKGGSGKTVVSTLVAKVLITNFNYKLLLIDADPTYPHFSKMMNVNPEKNLEIVKSSLITNVKSGNINSSEAAELIDFEVYNALVETKQFCLLYIGHPEEPGCFCPANAIMKKVIESISKDFEIVLIDCEAGLEQINRMVIQSVDILVIVSDDTQRSIDTSVSIRESANKFTQYKKIGIIVNRFKSNFNKVIDKLQKLGFSIFGLIPEDEIIRIFDFEGKPLLNLPKNAKSYEEVKKSVYKMLNL